MKCLNEFINDLNDEQLGQFIRMCNTYEQTNKINKTKDYVVNTMFNIYGKKEIDKKKYISNIRSKYAKKGKGRPKKKIREDE